MEMREVRAREPSAAAEIVPGDGDGLEKTDGGLLVGAVEELGNVTVTGGLKSVVGCIPPGFCAIAKASASVKSLVGKYLKEFDRYYDVYSHQWSFELFGRINAHEEILGSSG